MRPSSAPSSRRCTDAVGAPLQLVAARPDVTDGRFKAFAAHADFQRVGPEISEQKFHETVDERWDGWWGDAELDPPAAARPAFFEEPEPVVDEPVPFADHPLLPAAPDPAATPHADEPEPRDGTAAIGEAPPTPFERYVQGTERDLVARRSDSGRWLESHLFVILTVALSLPALVMPTLWLALCALGALAMLAVDSVRGQARKKGSADMVVVPGRVVGRILVGFVNPLNWVKVLLGAIASVVAGALLAALVGAARWIVSDGTEGILASIRMNAWAHALGYGAAFGCFLLLRGGGGTHKRRAAALLRTTRRVPEFLVAGLAVALAVACVSVVLAHPGLDLGFVHADDGLGWVPPGLRTLADQARDEAVVEELRSVTACLANGQANLWTATYTEGNGLQEPDVARLVADASRPQDQRALATAALVAQNHLAPWVETIVIASGDQVALTVDRAGIRTDTPLVDAALLRAHAAGAPDWLTTVAPSVDRAFVLECSARTPF